VKQRRKRKPKGKLIDRCEERLLTWPQLAKLVFPEIQKEMPDEWGDKTLDEFISNWPMPLDLYGWAEYWLDE
jgi:hypothetical protein